MSCSKFLWLWLIQVQSGQATEGYRLPVPCSAITRAGTPNRR